jgi:hypothetical protein
VLVVVQAVREADLVERHHAGPLASNGLVYAEDARERVLASDEPHRPGGAITADEGGACDRDLDREPVRGQAVAEPSVDAALGRLQDGEGLAPLVHLVQLAPHERRVDAASPMCGSHSHRRHVRDGDLAARDRHRHRERGGGADDLRTVERGERAVVLEERAFALEVLGFQGVAERELGRLEVPLELSRFDRADIDVHRPSLRAR